MIEFQPYQHVERFGTVETQNIEFGICFIFPKIDGTNGQIWYDNGIFAGSRKRILTVEEDNGGFYAYVLQQENIREFFKHYPELRLYGEWLIPHTLRTYHKESWRKFYVFDVMKDEEYLDYEYYKLILNEYNIDYIPALCKIENPTYERLIDIMNNNYYLIEDGKGTGEGIVIKRYDYKNKYGRTTWAKIVKNDFKTAHHRVETPELKEKQMIEQTIVDKYVNSVLVDKEFAKIEDWSSKLIPRLLNTIFYCLVKEESWNFVKEFKNPTVNFKTLQYLTIQKIKELKPEVF